MSKISGEEWVGHEYSSNDVAKCRGSVSFAF